MPVIEARSGSKDPPRQHNQPSRKGKKAWRKNVDIGEVEKGLVDLNEEIIRGYASTSLYPPRAMNRPSHSLFCSTVVP